MQTFYSNKNQHFLLEVFKANDYFLNQNLMSNF